MLVLQRKINEKILIGDDIVITVTKIIDGYAVKLGIEAPRDLLVRRLDPAGKFEGGQEYWRSLMMALALRWIR
jgi:hypothetical protein